MGSAGGRNLKRPYTSSISGNGARFVVSGPARNAYAARSSIFDGKKSEGDVVMKRENGNPLKKNFTRT